MNKPLLIGGGIIAAAALFLTAKAGYAATRLQMYINKIGFKLDGISPVVLIDVMVQNPTGNSFDISAFSGQAFLNGSLLGTVSYFNKITVAQLSETKLTLPVKVSLIGAGALLIDILNGKTKVAAKVQVIGTVNVNYVPVPVNIAQNII